VLLSIGLGIGLLLLGGDSSSQATAHTMSGLNAGIVRATELDRDGVPIRLALGIEGIASAAAATSSSSGSGLLALVPPSSLGAGDIAAAAVCTRYALLSIASLVSQSAADALHDATTLPTAPDFFFEDDYDKWQQQQQQEGDKEAAGSRGGVEEFLQSCVQRR
jgi:hypothetical protein